jgi:septal ring factor EnvC (AmiA/AmiB activator)
LSHKFNEREFLDKGFSLATVGFLRQLEAFGSTDIAVVSLDDIQKIVLQINQKSAQISQLENYVMNMEKTLNRVRANNTELQQQINDLTKRLTRPPVTNHEQRIADIERMVM